MSDDELYEVRLLRFPLRVHALATEHYEELLREFQLLALDPSPGRDVPRRLSALVAEISGAYGGVSSGTDAERDLARERGDEFVDLTYRIPRGAAEACARLNEMFDEADEFCRGDELLTLAAPEEAAAFRRWYLAEFSAQVAGAAPTPWTSVTSTQR